MGTFHNTLIGTKPKFYEVVRTTISSLKS